MNKKTSVLQNGCIILLLLLTAHFSYSQNNFRVTGKVTDDAGKPVDGATVLVKGTAIATATKADGTFEIVAPSENATLVISHVSFLQQEFPLKGQSQVSFSLTPLTSSLEDVVVVGYGTVRKRDVTGAVAGISEKEIKSRPVTDALQAMQGKIAGVDISSNERPGEIGTIRIRGVRSLNASNDPLYVVDQIPLMTGGIEYINPNDIESIDVLKDASATAIYGSRGANGVVIVTTKKGKAGRATLNLNLATTFETLRDDMEMFDAAEYITFRRWAYYYSNRAVYPRGDQPTIANDRIIFKATNDPMAWANIAQGWASGTWDGSKVQNTDWRGMVTQPGITKNLTIGVSAGSDKVKSYTSFGYLDNKGTQKGQGFKRYTAASNLDITATKWFTMGANLNVSYSIQEFGQSAAGRNTVGFSDALYGSARALFPYAVPYDSAGNRIETPGGDIAYKNVAEEWNLSQDQRTTLRAFGSLYAQVDLGAVVPALKNLRYRVNFGPDFSSDRDGSYLDAKSVIRNGSSFASLVKSQTFSYTLDHLLYYDKSIGRHDIGLTLLGSQTKYKMERSSISANGVDFGSQRWYALSNNYIPTADLQGYRGELTESQLQSVMARINYTFNDKYVLTASARRDGASMLAEGYKYDWFPSAAIAWRVKQESFLKDARWISDLKLRFGVGVTGNSSVVPYITQGIITSIFYPFTSLTSGATPPTDMPNVSLAWEKTTQYNIGIDFSLLNRRVSGSLDLYKSRTTDLIQRMNLPVVTGSLTTTANVAETANKGIDLSLTTVNISNRSFNWTTTTNISYQKDHIVSLSNGKQDDINNNLFIGHPQGPIYGIQGAGVWQAQDSALYKLFNARGHNFQPGTARPVDLNGDTLIDPNRDRTIIGYTRPNWIVGMTNTISYKGFEFSIFIYGRLKYMVNTTGEYQGARGTQRKIDYYTENNKNSEYQRPFYTEGAGDPYSGVLGYKKASFIKIRNISLGYNLDSKVLRTTAISGIKAYVQITNPGMLFRQIDWIDMDVNSSTWNRGITVGLNATF